MKAPRILVFLLLLLAITGCTTTQRTESLRDLDLPSAGGELDSSVWEHVDEVDPEGVHTASRETVWFFPLQFTGRNFKIFPTADRAVSTRFAYHDLLVLPLALPLSISLRIEEYERGTEQPVSSFVWRWTPLWNRVSGEPGPNQRIVARGIPLLYAHSRAEGNNLKVRWDQVLWTLGPARLEASLNEDEGGLKYFIAPLFLGGAGALAWAHYELEGPNNIVGHGPLLGYLGYQHSRRETEEELIFSRLLLSGVLWRDYIAQTNGGGVNRSAHGPLWSMIGWGRRDGQFALRLFWIPVTI